jgi:hypothetical protein
MLEPYPGGFRCRRTTARITESTLTYHINSRVAHVLSIRIIGLRPTQRDRRTRRPARA